MEVSKLVLWVIETIFCLTCVCGLLWQIVCISQLYFAYKVTTAIRIGIPETIYPTSFTLCTRFTDVVDYPRISKETGRDWKFSTTGPDIKRYQDEMTLKEIFEYTPAIDTVVKRAIMRNGDSYERYDLNDAQVYEYFEATKYFYLEHMCYRIRKKSAHPMPYSYYAVSPTSAGMIFEAYLNDTLIRSDLMKIMAHAADTFPYRSLKVAPVLWRQWDENKQTARYNAYEVYEIRLTSWLMPSPYESNCFDYRPEFKSDAQCLQECVKQKSMEQLDMVPFSIIVVDPAFAGNSNIVSVIDIQKPEIATQLLAIESNCSRYKCWRKQCTMVTTTTNVFALAAEEFSVKINVPSQPHITITTNASLSFVEYVTYVMSTISTWTGISIMSFMPVTVAKRFHMQVKSKNRVRTADTTNTSFEFMTKSRKSCTSPPAWLPVHSHQLINSHLH